MSAHGQLKDVSTALSWALCLNKACQGLSCHTPALPPFLRKNSKIKKSEPFVAFKLTQRYPFFLLHNNTIRYYPPYQFAKPCISNNAPVFDTKATIVKRGAERGLPDDVEIAAWHLHLSELRTAAARVGWSMVGGARRWSSCLRCAPANVVLPLKNWDGFYSLCCLFACFVTQNTRYIEFFFFKRWWGTLCHFKITASQTSPEQKQQQSSDKMSHNLPADVRKLHFCCQQPDSFDACLSVFLLQLLKNMTLHTEKKKSTFWDFVLFTSNYYFNFFEKKKAHFLGRRSS